MDLELAKLGASKRDEETNSTLVQAQVDLGEADPDDVEPFGEVPQYGALGVTALPHPANDDGYAEGIIARGLGNENAAVIAARDTRTASTTAELGQGETCVHATGPGFDARTFYKDGLIAHIVDDNFVVLQDRENKKWVVSGFGLAIEMSEKNGIVLEQGGAGISIKDGTVHIRGKVILGGMAGTVASQVCFSPALGAGVTGAWSVSPNVLIGL